MCPTTLYSLHIYDSPTVLEVFRHLTRDGTVESLNTSDPQEIRGGNPIWRKKRKGTGERIELTVSTYYSYNSVYVCVLVLASVVLVYVFMYKYY